MAELISRRAAKQLGQMHYFTGKPCLRGHISKRLATTANCVQCSREHDAERSERYGKTPERKQYERERYQRIKDRVRELQIRRQFGIGLKEYNELLVAQAGGCAICHKAPCNKRLGVDHCHVTGIVRGLLCDSCNGAIGLLRDDPQLLRKAIMYLERYKKDQ